LKKKISFSAFFGLWTLISRPEIGLGLNKKKLQITTPHRYCCMGGGVDEIQGVQVYYSTRWRATYDVGRYLRPSYPFHPYVYCIYLLQTVEEHLYFSSRSKSIPWQEKLVECRGLWRQWWLQHYLSINITTIHQVLTEELADLYRRHNASSLIQDF
jgi:hypothetical protein